MLLNIENPAILNEGEPRRPFRTYLGAAATTLLLLSPSLTLTGCYDQELDPTLDGVFFCEADADCALGSVCEAQECIRVESVVEPELEVLSPVELQTFASGDPGTLAIAVAGRGMTLGETGTNPGYVEVLLDGAAVASFTSGDLALGVENPEVTLPTAPGLHHLSFIAMKPDGTRYDADSAFASVGFWIDDGEEHLGVLRPAPGMNVDANTVVEVASLNLTLSNPSFTAEDSAEERVAYGHLYIDTGVPGCLPDCNQEHHTMVAPSGLSKVNRIVVPDADLPVKLGTTWIHVVAQSMSQGPYTRTDTSVVTHGVAIQVAEASQ